jgi:hypothetical protein
MAEVIDLARPRGPPTPSYQHIRTGSRIFAVLFTGLLVFFSAVTILGAWVVLFYRGAGITLNSHGVLISLGRPPPVGAVTFASLSVVHRLAYAGVWLTRAAPTLFLFGYLRQLFGLYARGQVFAPRNADLIKAMGVCLIADGLLPFVIHLAPSATGYEIDRNWAHMVSLQELVLGGVVFVVAGVMQVGREIEEDREGFV